MRQPTTWVGLLVAVAVVLVYANTLKVPFLFDDRDSIVGESDDPAAGPGDVFAAGRGLTVDGRPVLNASLALNFAVGGMDVRGYHAVNITIHALAALTLFGLVRRTLVGGWVGNRFADQATEVGNGGRCYFGRSIRCKRSRSPISSSGRSRRWTLLPPDALCFCAGLVGRGDRGVCAGNGDQGGDGRRL